MKPILIACAWAAALLAGSDAWSQDVSWTESRFHRVHLRNGNVIDGQMLQEDARTVTLGMPAGRMLIRRDQIERVELVKMRSIAEAPKVLPAPASRPPAFTAFPAVPMRAAPAIPVTGLEARIEVLLEACARNDAEAQDCAREALLELGAEAAPVLARRFGSVPAEALEVVKSVLITLKNPETTASLKECMVSSRAKVRAGAAQILGSMVELTALGDMRRLLGDAEPEVRAAAAAALTRFGERDSFEDLAPLLGDPNAMVRTRAAAGLSALSSRHGLEADLTRILKDALASNPPAVKAELLSTIGGLGQRKMWDLASPYLWDDDMDVRAQAGITLARLAAPESGQVLLDRLVAEREYWPRVQLADAARCLKLRPAVPLLMEWLSEENPNIQMAASRALKGITAQNFGLDRDRWDAWWSLAQPRQ